VAAVSSPVNEVMSVLGVRRAIGVIGIGLPFLLAIGGTLLEGLALESSISAYYYTVMGGVFVGSLCAQGVFLVAYRYRRRDAVLSTAAGVLVIAVALLPTAPAEPTPSQAMIGVVHLLCAGGFYLLLAYFCLFLFTRTHKDGTPPTPRKILRNRVYRSCGAGVLVGVAGAGLAGLGGGSAGLWQPVFWFETLAGIAFGTAWLIKGETLLRDR
jgi:hypothetical protein